MRVEHHRAEVLVVDRAARGVGGLFDRDARRPCSLRACVNDASQPSASRPTRRSSDGALPPSHTSSGLRGLGQHGHALVVEAARRRGRRRPRSRAGGERQRFVEDRGPVARARRRTPAARPGARCRARTRGAPGRPRARRASPTPSRRSAGLRPGSTCTLVPSLIFFVRAAANVRPRTGSGAGPLMRSESQSESKPCALERVGQRAEPRRPSSGRRLPSP